MRLLFVKPSLAFPRSTGHDVYCYFMMKSLAQLGAEVSLATLDEVDPRAIEGIRLAQASRLSENGPSSATTRLTPLQERFRSFWGISAAQIESVRQMAAASKPDVVIAFGLQTLPYLAGVDHALRVWAMADEWVYHHLSQVSVTDVRSWGNMKEALIKGLYERAYRPLVDRIWVVSEADRRAARWFAGMKVADLLPNGVDTEFYSPRTEMVMPASAVFWGRLDFGPNIDALQWFFKNVWAGVIRQVPAATFTIIGYAPTPAVEQLTQLPGVSLLANVPDLRSAVCQRALVVLPFVSGGGIKNKLLEGAAMGRPIVCTPHACKGLRHDGALPMVLATSPAEWVTSMTALWSDESGRAELGRQARQWVGQHYSWSAPARDAIESFRTALAGRR